MGNRLPLVVRIPFCTESSSGGKPSDPHLHDHTGRLSQNRVHGSICFIRSLQCYHNTFQFDACCQVSKSVARTRAASHLLISTSSVRRLSTL